MRVVLLKYQRTFMNAGMGNIESLNFKGKKFLSLDISQIVSYSSTQINKITWHKLSFYKKKIREK